ncbi:MAG: stage V sporulation protein AC [Bacilli bacterium]
MKEKSLHHNYPEAIKKFMPKKNKVWSKVKAFVVGGLICVLGQGISELFIRYFDFSKEDAGNPTVATLILLSTIFTGLGVYDKLGQFAGAGSAVPVTGFANSMASAAIDFRSEGIVLGTASNMFKLAGSVIVFGVVSAYIVGCIRFLIEMMVMK